MLKNNDVAVAVAVAGHVSYILNALLVSFVI